MASTQDDGDSAATAQRPAPPKPLDVDGVQTVLVGTVLWVVAFVVLLLFRGELDEQGRAWWLWTALAGAGLGMLGYEYTRRRRDAIARVRRYRTEHPDGGAPPQNDSPGPPQKGRSVSDS